jgi:hypothetical protein
MIPCQVNPHSAVLTWLAKLLLTKRNTYIPEMKMARREGPSPVGRILNRQSNQGIVIPVKIQIQNLLLRPNHCTCSPASGFQCRLQCHPHLLTKYRLRWNRHILSIQTSSGNSESLDVLVKSCHPLLRTGKNINKSNNINSQD